MASSEFQKILKYKEIIEEEGYIIKDLFGGIYLIDDKVYSEKDLEEKVKKIKRGCSIVNCKCLEYEKSNTTTSIFSKLSGQSFSACGNCSHHISYHYPKEN